eukprot:scaffold259619_cov41-Tisochrysis_lutea.AAC.1
MAARSVVPISEDGSGLLCKLGRQPLSHLVNLPATSVADGTTVEGCLRTESAALRSPEFEHECAPYRVEAGASLFLQAATSAAEAVRLACKRSALLSTGFPLLDAELGGGLQTGEICELAGPSCTGKTQLCMAVCAHQLLRTDFHVLYIDTCLSFTAERMRGLIEAEAVATSSAPSDDVKHAIKKKLHARLRVCTEAQSLLCLLDTLEVLCCELSNATDPGDWHRRLKLVAIDSVFVAALAESDGNSQSIAGMSFPGDPLHKARRWVSRTPNKFPCPLFHVGAQMARLQHLLRYIAARWQIVFLICNVLATSPGAGGNPANMASFRTALGYLWQHTSHIRVGLLPLTKPRGEHEGNSLSEQLDTERSEGLSRIVVHRVSHTARQTVGQTSRDGPKYQLCLCMCGVTHRLHMIAVNGARLSTTVTRF